MKDATCIGGQGRLSGGTGTSRMIPMDKISQNGRIKLCGEGGKGDFEFPEAGVSDCVDIGLKEYFSIDEIDLR